MNFRLKSFLKNGVVRNAGWLIGEQIFQMVLSFVIGVISARYLGPANYGSLNYTASFIAFFNSVCTLGMDGVVVKKMIDKPDKEGEYLGGCLILRLCSSFLSMISVVVLVWALNPNDPIKIVLAGIQSIRMLFEAVYVLNTWFQRHLKAKYISLSKMIAAIVVAAYKIVLLATLKSVVWFAFASVLSYIVNALLLYCFYRKESPQKLKPAIAHGWDVLGESYHFILSGIMTSIYGQMDKIMIGKMLGDSEVAYYTLSLTIASMWIFVPTAIVNSLRPSILEAKRVGNEKEYTQRLLKLYSIIIWTCLVVAVFGVLLIKPAIYILYGEAYLPAVNSFRIVIWSELFSMIGVARGVWIVSENKNKYVKYYLAIGSVFNLVMNFVLIPMIGTLGAAIATLITQIITSMIAPLFFKETRMHTALVLKAFVFSWRKKE